MYESFARFYDNAVKELLLAPVSDKGNDSSDMSSHACKLMKRLNAALAPCLVLLESLWRSATFVLYDAVHV